MNELRREGIEIQLAMLEDLRDETLGEDIQICVHDGCYVKQGEHNLIPHRPQYWPIDQAINRLRFMVEDPTHIV